MDATQTIALAVLFLGDLSRGGVALGEYLINTYGAELHADFVQAGHHGNRGQPVSFYAAVCPKVLFQDAPDRVFTGENYDAKDLKAWRDESALPEGR